jgi:hypothetical protein
MLTYIHMYTPVNYRMAVKYLAPAVVDMSSQRSVIFLCKHFWSSFITGLEQWMQQLNLLFTHDVEMLKTSKQKERPDILKLNNSDGYKYVV